MAVEVDTALTAQVAALYKDPSLEGMLALEWYEFEDFVRYVFEQAGYSVQKVGPDQHYHVDLLLRRSAGGPVEGRVEVRRYGHALVKRAVLAFFGALVAEGGQQGFLVTTSDFTQPAKDLAQTLNGRVQLVNGHQLLRYIRYVRGSRLTEDDQAGDGLVPLGPEAMPAFPLAEEPPISPTYLLDADAIARRDPHQTTVLALVNNKGGVAKTTTTLNTALVLAERRSQRVLVVDMDGQASLTALLPPPAPPTPRKRRGQPAAPPPPTPTYPSLIDYLQRRCSLGKVIRPTRFPHVWLVPADDRLFRKDMGGATRPELLAFVRHLHDSTLVAPNGAPFDWILLDTAPAQNFYTRAALAASHYVVVPACAETLAINGAKVALATADTMRALMEPLDHCGKPVVPAVEVAGALVTRWKQNVTAQQSLVNLVDRFRSIHSRVFSTKIHEDGRVERALKALFGGALAHLLRMAPGPAASDYEAFVKELFPYVQRN
jgi:cellulose biosynthesis protein BcsQ